MRDMSITLFCPHLNAANDAYSIALNDLDVTPLSAPSIQSGRVAKPAPPDIPPAPKYASADQSANVAISASQSVPAEFVVAPLPECVPPSLLGESSSDPSSSVAKPATLVTTASYNRQTASVEYSACTDLALIEPKPVVLLSKVELNIWRRSDRAHVHKVMRCELNRISAANPLEPQDLIVSVDDDLPWKAYIAFHENAELIIGPGISRFTAQFIQGTKDPNRKGQLRLDFVAELVNGDKWRFHPSLHDAKPIFVSASVAEPGSQPATRGATLPQTGVWTLSDAMSLPQIDMIGKKDAWHQLSAARTADTRTIDISDGNAFAWWRWVSNLGARTASVIGPGVQSATCTYDAADQMTVRFGRVDGTAINIQLRATRARGLQVHID